MSDTLETPEKEYTFPQEEVKNTEQTPVETDKEKNMRVLRERADAAERKNQENERRMQEMERIIQQNMQQKSSQKIELVDDDADDDLFVEKREVKKLKKELKEQRDFIEQQSQQYAINSAELTLKSRYADYDNVMTEDNLQRLSKEKPHLYKSILSNPNISERYQAAYDIMKSTGIAENPYEDTSRRLEDNKQKPRSAATTSAQTSETPLSRVGDFERRILSESDKERIRKQVEFAKSLR